MKLLIYKNNGSKPVNVVINFWVLFFFVLTVISLVFISGFFVSKKTAHVLYPHNEYAQLLKQIQNQDFELETIRTNSAAEIDAMATRIAELQASITRVNALGVRMIKTAKIDASEFDFEHPPALGGPEDMLEVQLNSLDTIEQSIDALDEQVSLSLMQLNVIEQNIANKTLKDSVKPKGRPVKKGWVSSRFGWRINPFGGNKEFHAGVDIAAVEGTQVLAVGGGVVTWSGPRYGYGNMVEIMHGDGYITRYAHNKSNLVKEGQTVKKGDSLALVGSTGRSTGPHIHFEVLKDGKKIDPSAYLTPRE